MIRALVAGALLIAFSGSASAQEDTAYVDYRQNLMRGIGANMAAIGDVFKHGLPLQTNLAGHATNLETGAGQIAAAFNQRVTDGKTDAKADIWDDTSGFEQAIAEFQAQSGKLAEAARAGDMAAMGAQVREVGKACSGCHEPYRKPKEESYKNR